MEDDPLALAGRSNWRCWSVDFRSEDDLFGMVLKYEFVGGSPYLTDQSTSSMDRLSDALVCGSDSNMLKSELGPCRLRLFAEGLPKLVRSMVNNPSFRFIGLGADDFEPKWPLIRFSDLEVVIFGADMKSIPSSFSLSIASKKVSFG